MFKKNIDILSFFGIMDKRWKWICGIVIKKLEWNTKVSLASSSLNKLGEHHFHEQLRESHISRKRDEMKRRSTAQLNLNVLEVPYWWDGSLSSFSELFQNYKWKS